MYAIYKGRHEIYDKSRSFWERLIDYVVITRFVATAVRRRCEVKDACAGGRPWVRDRRGLDMKH